ncbi:hypothetical protein [Lactiplantibacillus pentosus]|jgi:hypothetical protein|uniref:hypothetical protein n=1 Tax=Lactiplantibacillus pentosus TaxID=1589 RepID=UPI0021A4A4DA|nr:hypothetical protein [Lactiplantibacillus pentosus]MCT3285677.1 hypothetical protein [Lactiplantibacillus pentosus]
MVKQGRYAGVSKQKRLRQLKQRHQAKEQRAIRPGAVGEFLQVRYHLTQAGQQRPVMRQTMQRFMSRWLANAQDLLDEDEQTTWSMTALTKQAMQQFNRQLPWQGYALLDQEMPRWTAFLTKEVPAVPLQERISLVEPLTIETWQDCLTEQLAVNTMLAMTHNNRQQLQQVQADQIQSLQTSIQTANGVDWEKVAQLLGPTVTEPDPLTSTMMDNKTKQWLKRLNKLTSAKFNADVE